jgi:transcriptional repressor NrdR
MKCPACDQLDTRVIDSRSSKDDAEIRRRRVCDACSHRFTTYERAEKVLPLVIKKDNRREPWNRNKILRGLIKACEKRPISIDIVEKLADSIADDLGAKGEAEVSSELIGERVMVRLRDIDEVAYVRFASVYRSFKDVGGFVEEVELLSRDRKKDL